MSLSIALVVFESVAIMLSAISEMAIATLDDRSTAQHLRGLSYLGKSSRWRETAIFLEAMLSLDRTLDDRQMFCLWRMEVLKKP